jgi:hypothetical protein
MTDYATSLDLVAGLVQQFRTNRAAYHAPEYKEAHARQDLIDPLFIALGWDVHNAEHAAPQYRSVPGRFARSGRPGRAQSTRLHFPRGRDAQVFRGSQKAQRGPQDRRRPGVSTAALCVERQAALFAPYRFRGAGRV